MNECECHNWASDGQFSYAMTGHHARCSKLDQERLLRDTERLLWQLVTGIEAWAHEEDGVYPELFEAYRTSCRKLGKIQEPDHVVEQPSEDPRP